MNDSCEQYSDCIEYVKSTFGFQFKKNEHCLFI